MYRGYGSWGMMDRWMSLSMPILQVLALIAILLSIVALWKYISHGK